MDCALRLQLQYQAAILQAELNLQNANLDVYAYLRLRRRKRRGRRRRWWLRVWLGPERRRQFGLYDQLMDELRREDEKSFLNFLRIPPEMFDEVLERVRPRITKKHTWWRAPIDPGMKLAVTLRHLASGSKYTSMQFGWRAPHNTISIIVREVNITLLLTHYPGMTPGVVMEFGQHWHS